MFLPKPTAFPFSLSANNQLLTVFHIKTNRGLKIALTSFSSKLSSLTFLPSLTTILLVLWLSPKASPTFSHPCWISEPENDGCWEEKELRAAFKVGYCVLKEKWPHEDAKHPHFSHSQGRKVVRTSPSAHLDSFPIAMGMDTGWPASHRPINLKVLLMYACRGYYFSAYKN